MAIFLTSGNPIGFRALGSGGRSAATSYEQIVRTLRQALGPDHAALFAEPNTRASAIDWFANIDSEAAPKRLVDAPQAEAQAGLARLESLVRDIEAKIVSLQKSDRQDERILGEMLAHGLEFPDENAVFLVGAQPVITFWGYVLDKGRPAVSPLRALLLRRRQTERVDGAEALPGYDGASGGAPTGGQGDQTSPRSNVGTRGVGVGLGAGAGRAGALVRDVPWLVPATLWGILILLLLTCALELVRGCAVALPGIFSAWVPGECTASTAPPVDLAAEQAKQDRLRSEYDDLIRQAALDRKACRVKTGQADIPRPPVVAPPPHIVIPTPPKVEPVVVPDRDKLRIPEKKTDTFDFLEGCWKAHEGLTEVKNGKNTGRKLDFHYCFNKDGTGATTIRYQEDGAKCSGPLRATFADQILKIAFDDAPCEGSHGQFSAGTATCKRGESGIAICEEYSGHNTKPDFVDFPFIRAADNP